MSCAREGFALIPGCCSHMPLSGRCGFASLKPRSQTELADEKISRTVLTVLLLALISVFALSQGCHARLMQVAPGPENFQKKIFFWGLGLTGGTRVPK